MKLKRWLTRSTQIRGTLIRNYTAILFIVVLAFIASIVLFGVLLAAQLAGGKTDEDTPLKRQKLIFYSDNGEDPKLLAYQIAKPDYRSIDAGEITRLGGWVELLDDQNRVIHVIGHKPDSVSRYSSRELMERLANDPMAPYYASIAPITTSGGRDHSVLVMIPSSSLVRYLYPAGLSEGSANAVAMSFLASVAAFFLLFSLLIYFYGRWTANRIARPFHLITDGIQQMTRGHYDTRLRFHAENEFLQIRDAFNYMVEQLQITEMEKVRLEASKQRMIVDISHDLKTPITTIQGYAKALHDGLVTEETKQRRYLKMIENKAHRVAELIENLFELSRIEQAEYVLDKTDGDMNEFTRQIVAEHYEEIEQKGFELMLRLPEEEVSAVFDRKQMGRVLSNILVNAVKYNPPGTRLRVSLEEAETNIRLEIADNGVGICEPLKRIIFEPFVRGDEARQSDGGAGLGLAIAKTLIEKHGGRLQLSSNRSEPTVFQIEIPKKPR